MGYVGAHVILHRHVGATRDSDETVLVVLLCKRTQDAPTDPGRWSFFGGTREEADRNNPIRTAIREVEEELTVDISGIQLEPIGRLPVHQESGAVYVEYFASLLDQCMDTLSLRRNGTAGFVEGEGLAWFTAGEIDALDIRAADRQALQIFFADHA